MNILVLSGSSQKKLVETAEKRKHYIEVFDPVDFNIYLSDNPKGWDALYHNENEKLKAKNWDCVITRIGTNRDYACQVLIQLQVNMHKWSLQSAWAINTCANKIKTAQICSANKIKVPKQWYAVQPKNIAFMIEKLGGLSVILKEISGSKGANIILLESPLQTNLTLESYYKKGVKFILQEYLNNGGKDQRHIVVGDKVVCSMERQAPKNDIRANVSLEGTAKKITASKEVEKICVDAVASIPGLNFAGVDIIEHQDNNYLIEINSNPGTHIIEVTGHNYFEDILDFCEKHHKDKQDVANSSAQEKQEFIEDFNAQMVSCGLKLSQI
ncbi:MAG: RimK family alpha-L-glutamate ligase [Bacteroidales bacterium]|jgi:ribosomal protein S6--L-glutamate ligase|nr:RimK family alpha-L-glutamate ligase [Bacteroidales bacterium]